MKRDPRLSGAASLLGALLLSEACARLSGAPASTPSDAALAKGQQVYVTYCQSCHGDAKGNGRQPNVASHGPDGHTWHHSDRDLTEIVEQGSDSPTSRMMREMMGPPDTPRMPAWKGTLSYDDIRAVLAYIKTFWTPEQRRLQQESPMMP